MIPMEVLTLGGSAVLGAAIKLWSKSIENTKANFEMAVKRTELTEASRVAASARDPIGQIPEKLTALTAPIYYFREIFGGMVTRRLIVMAVLFTVFIAPVFIAWWFPNVPVYYAYNEEQGRWLFGLFGPAMEKLKYIKVEGLVILPVHSQVASAICGFYFGSSAAK